MRALAARRPGARRRARGEGGAVAVEAALVIPILMLLVFGIVDFSMMLRDYVSVTSATRAGSRVASAAAAAGPCVVNAADTTLCTTPSATPAMAQMTADAMQKALTAVPGNSVNYLIVYQANANGYPCPSSVTTNAACQTNTASVVPSSCSGFYNCNMFTWNATKAAFRYSSGTWSSAGIDACINEQDSVGVYLRVTHKWLTGEFVNPLPLTDRSVMKFEPLSDDTCKPLRPSAHQ